MWFASSCYFLIRDDAHSAAEIYQMNHRFPHVLFVVCLLRRTPSAAVTGPRSGCMFQSGWRTHKFFSGVQRRLCRGSSKLVASPATLASAAWRLPKIMKPALLLQLLQASTPRQTSTSTTLSHQKSPAEDGMVTNRLAHIHQSAAECASGWLPAARPNTALTDHLAGTLTVE